MQNTITTPFRKPHNIALYVILAFLTFAGGSESCWAGKTNACEHANGNAAIHSNGFCDGYPDVETATIPEPTPLPLISAGLLIWYGISHRKNR